MNETLQGVQIRAGAVYVYMYMSRGNVWHNSSACLAYLMWAELGHSHFLYDWYISNVVTNGNGTDTKIVLKLNRALGFVYSIQSSVYGATTVAKVSLFSTWTRSTVTFYSNVSVEINPFSCEQTSVI